MTKANLKLIDETIQKYGDDFWNDPNTDDGEESPNPNRKWIIEEILEILAKDNLDLTIIRKK